MVDGIAALLWLANQAAIELHPFLWRVEAPREPTQVVLDLDPGPPAGLVEAARVALALRPLLQELGLDPHVKTSGSLGLHVHAPLAEPADTKRLARGLATAIAALVPDLVVREVRRAARSGKVYVDWLQNDPTRQTVAPYSLRGLPWPVVATPVRWEEVEAAAAEERPELLFFTPADVLERIERDGDPAAPSVSRGRSDRGMGWRVVITSALKARRPVQSNAGGRRALGGERRYASGRRPSPGTKGRRRPPRAPVDGPLPALLPRPRLRPLCRRRPSFS